MRAISGVGFAPSWEHITPLIYYFKTKLSRHLLFAISLQFLLTVWLGLGKHVLGNTPFHDANRWLNSMSSTFTNLSTTSTHAAPPLPPYMILICVLLSATPPWFLFQPSPPPLSPQLQSAVSGVVCGALGSVGHRQTHGCLIILCTLTQKATLDKHTL